MGKGLVYPCIDLVYVLSGGWGWWVYSVLLSKSASVDVVGGGSINEGLRLWGILDFRIRFFFLGEL